MSQFWKIDDPSQIDERLTFFGDWLRSEWNWSKPVTFEPKPYTDKRSLSANALLHVWFRELATHFSRQQVYGEEQIKELLVHKFLGTEDRVVGKTVIPGQLRKTSQLNSGEMKQFMDQILAWGADHGCLVSLPKDSEYKRWMETNDGI